LTSYYEFLELLIANVLYFQNIKIVDKSYGKTIKNMIDEFHILKISKKTIGKQTYDIVHKNLYISKENLPPFSFNEKLLQQIEEIESRFAFLENVEECAYLECFEPPLKVEIAEQLVENLEAANVPKELVKLGKKFTSHIYVVMFQTKFIKLHKKLGIMSKDGSFYEQFEKAKINFKRRDEKNKQLSEEIRNFRLKYYEFIDADDSNFIGIQMEIMYIQNEMHRYNVKLIPYLHNLHLYENLEFETTKDLMSRIQAIIGDKVKIQSGTYFQKGKKLEI
jgi:hypothetical protein